MFQLRKGSDRGNANFGWLDSKHSFSFGGYRDPEHMGFRNLRVINEDAVQPSKGFGMHGHSDMEIISYVIEGELEHKDSMNNGSVITKGDVQRMSAGKGVRHSEFNPSTTNHVHFLQIWILPRTNGVEPSYEERNFNGLLHNQMRLLISGDETDDAMDVNADLKLHGSRLDAGKNLKHSFTHGRSGWIQVVKGAITVSDGDVVQPLAAGDGLAMQGVSRVMIQAKTNCEFLLFDLP